MKEYIKITRKDCGEFGYVDTKENLSNIIQGEFDGAEIGDSITLTLIEMEEKEFKNLPEFAGW